MTAGKVLRSISGWNWKVSNGTDDFGFSILPAGYRYDTGEYKGDSIYVFFWSSTESGKNSAYEVDENASQDWYYKDTGFAVRCVKD